MTQLGTAIAEKVILNYGQAGFLSRLSDPFWFQSYGAVMGMDRHSSGTTTSVLGALKKGMNPRFSELGVMFCGGRGRHSTRTPDELRMFSQKAGLDGDALARIFVVDDEAVIANTLAIILNQAGFDAQALPHAKRRNHSERKQVTRFAAIRCHNARDDWCGTDNPFPKSASKLQGSAVLRASCHR